MYYYEDDTEIVFHCFKIKVQLLISPFLHSVLKGYTLHNYLKINIELVLADLNTAQVYSVL